MNSTSPGLEELLRHYAGYQRLERMFARENWREEFPRYHIPTPPRWVRIMRRIVRFLSKQEHATPLLVSPKDLKSSFGKREFNAAVCFVDMVGFSNEAKGKSPKEVAAMISPFLQTVIHAATKSQCFVDKTIGDEVMVVMPVFPSVKNPLSDLAWFLARVVHGMETSVPGAKFRAGIALGRVYLEDIRTESYHEWSVFGNCVNGAKRLQLITPPNPERPEPAYPFRAIIGAVDTEYPSFMEEFETWLHAAHRNVNESSPIEFINIRKDCEELKGVGRMCFHDTFIRGTRC